MKLDKREIWVYFCFISATEVYLNWIIPILKSQCGALQHVSPRHSVFTHIWRVALSFFQNKRSTFSYSQYLSLHPLLFSKDPFSDVVTAPLELRVPVLLSFTDAHDSQCDTSKWAVIIFSLWWMKEWYAVKRKWARYHHCSLQAYTRIISVIKRCNNSLFLKHLFVE